MEMMNPSYRFHTEMKERLERYEMLNFNNIQCDFYSLKAVKLDPEEVIKNPILKKGQEYLDMVRTLGDDENFV